MVLSPSSEGDFAAFSLLLQLVVLTGKLVDGGLTTTLSTTGSIGANISSASLFSTSSLIPFSSKLFGVPGDLLLGTCSLNSDLINKETFND